MKTIKKIKNNLGKVAGSALLVGATFATGGAMVTAQDSGSSGDLGDFPAPFVSEDGEVDTSVVVGETAQDGQPVSTLDVVSGIEIAGALGNAAFMESEESVSVEGTSASWTAENGVTLNRQNSNIFFPEDTNVEQTRFDDQDINALATTTVQSEANEEVEVEHDLRVGQQPQQFDTAGDLDNPVLHVDVPTSPEVDSATDYLLQASVQFDETMNFNVQESDSGFEALEDGDTLELFGQEYTYSDESDDTELVLYGSSDRFEVDTGESQTVTFNGNEVTFEVSYVTDASGSDREATITVDGSTQTVAESDTINVGDTEVRVSDIYRTGADGQGRVAFSEGSDELVITDSDVEVDGDSVDGVDVELDSSTGDFTSVDGITFAFGAEDSDEDYVAAGETYETPLFGLEFQYGGLAPNAAEDPAETLELNVQEDDDAEFTFMTGGEEATVSVAEYDGTNLDFGDDDGQIAEYEGEFVGEDEKVVLNANEEAEMYEITDVDNTDLSDGDSDGTISVTMDNVVTGDSVEIEVEGEDFSGLSEYTEESESIGGMDFDVTFDASADEVSFMRSSADADHVQVLPWMYTDSGATVTFADYDENGGSEVVDLTDLVDNEDFTASGTIDMSTNDEAITLDTSGNSNYAKVEVSDGTNTEVLEANSGTDTTSNTYQDASVEYEILAASDTQTVTLEDQTVSDSTTVSANAPTKTVEVPSGVASNDAEFDVTYSATDTVSTADPASDLPDFVQTTYELNAANGNYLDITDGSDNPSVLVTQPENDDDEEQAYKLDVVIDDSTATLNRAATDTARQDADMDDEDVTAAYDTYGAYSEYDFDDSAQKTFTLNMPAAQATSGMAVTGTDGALSAEGGGSGSVTSMMPTYEFANGVLDSDNNIGQVRNSDNLILVGGPSVNQLVADLASEGETMTASEYTEGEGMIQHVPNAFSEGQDAVIVAGYSGEDTRAAGEFLADYRNNEGSLEGNTQVTISTESGQVVN